MLAIGTQVDLLLLYLLIMIFTGCMIFAYLFALLHLSYRSRTYDIYHSAFQLPLSLAEGI